MARPRVAVFKLTSCDGCQLQLLSLEDELLALSETVDIIYFAEATSRRDDGLPFDVALVEGSISTPEQADEIRTLRQRSRHLVTIGACATAGGIQALRNFADVEAFVRVVYASPATIDALSTSTPISAHVRVDFSLRGCPVDKHQLLDLLGAIVHGRRPNLRDESVCAECKRRGAVCVTVTRGEPCLGPITHAGCGALCPRFDRGCYGCFGPKENAATAALADHLTESGVERAEVVRRLRTYNAWAPEFRETSEALDD